MMEKKDAVPEKKRVTIVPDAKGATKASSKGIASPIASLPQPGASSMPSKDFSMGWRAACQRLVEVLVIFFQLIDEALI